MAELVAARNRVAYAKVGVYGFGGTGKTFTSARIAVGLEQMHEKKTGEKKKCAFFETEVGSDFVKRQFEEAGYELLVMYSRSFMDLLDVFDKAIAADCNVVIVDSVTHVWRDLVDGYLKAKNKKRLEMQDWDPLKKEWAKFTDKFLTSKIHAIICGRAGNVYEFQENDDGKKEVIKVGTKMKAEGEFEYEPSLVIEMFKKDVEKETRARTGDKVYEVACIVLKDRADKLDGKIFIEPKFEDFMPHWDYLNMGGDHLAIAESDTSRMFSQSGESYYRKKLRRDRALEDLSNIMTKYGVGKTTAENSLRVRLAEECFGTANRVDLENTVNLDTLEYGVRLIRDSIEEILAAFSQSKDGKFNLKSIIDDHREALEKKDLEAAGIKNDPDDIDDSAFGGQKAPATQDQPGGEIAAPPVEPPPAGPNTNDAPPDQPAPPEAETVVPGREPGDDSEAVQQELLKG